MFMHMMYGIAGMQPFLNNVFFLFGIWHAYMYAHTALWDRFRLTFLADAFFALFPKTILMRKPSLFKSSVFFTWLRISYPDFRDELRERLIEFQLEYLTADREWPRNEEKITLARAWFTHCLNLYTLFEYAIPVIQDYGTCIKLNSVTQFMQCFEKLLLLLIMFQSTGSHMYSRAMILFLGNWNYWIKTKRYY